MRHALQTVLLLSFALSLFGSTTLMVVRHQHGRRRVDTMLTRSGEHQGAGEMTHLVVVLSEDRDGDPPLVRIGREEVIYEGGLYDVIREELRGDTLHLWGFRDREEEEAASRLASHFDGAGRDYGLAVASSPSANLQLIYCLQLVSAVRRPFPSDLRYGVVSGPAMTSPFGEVPHPPPRG